MGAMEIVATIMLIGGFLFSLIHGLTQGLFEEEMCATAFLTIAVIGIWGLFF